MAANLKRGSLPSYAPRLYRFAACCFAGLLVLFSTPVVASPVQILECTIRQSFGPFPEILDTSSFTMRRHWVQSDPISELTSEFWSVADLQSGFFELDFFTLDGSKFTENGKDLNLHIQDGRIEFGDEIADQALASERRHVIDDYAIEGFGYLLRRSDGEAIHTHLELPIIDLDNWDLHIPFGQSEAKRYCYVQWRDLIRRFDCNPLRGCEIGEIRGEITSVTNIPHEQDHGGATFTINPGINDAWFNPATNGQGFFIIVYPEIPLVFLAWFTYEVEGDSALRLDRSLSPAQQMNAILGDDNHRWITAQGSFEGDTAILDIVVTRGGVFDSGEPAPENTIEGSMEVSFEDCETGVVKYDMPDLGLSGEVPIQRIANDNVPLCEELSE